MEQAPHAPETFTSTFSGSKTGSTSSSASLIGGPISASIGCGVVNTIMPATSDQHSASVRSGDQGWNDYGYEQNQGVGSHFEWS